MKHLNVQKKRISKCPYCEEMIPISRRAFHFDEKHGITAPTCGVCSKKFRLPSVLLSHQKNAHMREKNFSCDMCDMKFFNNYQMQKHKIKHVAERKYKCDFCNKTFVWKTNLTTHMMIHTGEKPRVCKYCNASFVQTASLSYHMAKHHPNMVWN